MKNHNPLLNNAEQAHIDNIRANHSAVPENAGIHPTPLRSRLTDLLNNISYQDAFKWITNVLALSIMGFYVVALVHDFDKSNALASVPALVHVTASIGICLAMSVTPALSGMRFFQIAALLLLANLG